MSEIVGQHTKEKQKNTPPQTPKINEEAFSNVRKASHEIIRKVVGTDGRHPESLVASLSLLNKQEQQRQILMEDFGGKKEDILVTSSEGQKNLLTEKARKSLYENLGIDVEKEKNSGMKKFIKGIIDGAILGNMEFVESVAKDPSKAIDALKSLFSLEGIKQALTAVGKSIMDLVSGDPYDTGKSLGELGLVATGAGIAYGIAKKGMKSALKLGVRETVKDTVKQVKSPKESIVQAEKILGRELSENERKALFESQVSPKMGDYKAFSKQRGALGERIPVQFTAAKKRMQDGLAANPKLEYTVPQSAADMGRFENRLLRPIDCLNDLVILRKNLNINELVGNFRGITEFTNSMQKFSDYILANTERFGPKLAEDIAFEANALRREMRTMLQHPAIDVLDTVQLMTVLENDFNRALTALQGRFRR